MIFDIASGFARYESIHPLFPKVLNFLQRQDLIDLPEGRHELDGENLFAIVIKAAGKPSQDAQLEIHNDFIDIQLVLQGVEAMGWKARAACTSPVDDYDPERDLQFFTDLPDSWIKVQPGQFAVFFPEDAHAPMVSPDVLHKIVIKVGVSNKG